MIASASNTIGGNSRRAANIIPATSATAAAIPNTGGASGSTARRSGERRGEPDRRRCDQRAYWATRRTPASTSTRGRQHDREGPARAPRTHQWNSGCGSSLTEAAVTGNRRGGEPDSARTRRTVRAGQRQQRHDLTLRRIKYDRRHRGRRGNVIWGNEAAGPRRRRCVL